MHVDEVLQKCDQTYVIFDTSIILDYIRLSSRDKNHRLEVLSYIINNCRNKVITLLNLEEILVGNIGNKEEIENFIFYSFKILNITEKEAEVTAELEVKVREEGLGFKGENWRIDLFIASFAYTRSYYILTKDSDFKKILDCKLHLLHIIHYLELHAQGIQRPTTPNYSKLTNMFCIWKSDYQTDG